MEITIFKNILETSNPEHVFINDAIDRIRNGNSKSLIEKIRTIPEKKERDKYKRQLPSICFSGTFNKRANNAIINHSGYVCLDFDHLDNPEDFKLSVSNDKYCLSAFISPSGDGVKVIIKIPNNIKTHAASCRALKDYFKNEKLDNFEDVARVCYESYDSSATFNYSSEIFTDLIHEKIQKTVTQTVNTNSNDIFEKLKKWIEKVDTYGDGNKHKFLVKFAGSLNRFGVNKDDCVNLLIREYQGRAGYVKSQDFESLINRVYNSYSSQYNTCFFDATDIAIDKKTTKRLSKDFFNDFKVTTIDEIKTTYNNCLIDLTQDVERPPTILMRRALNGLKESRILTLGNISVISGKAKSKKSYLQSMIAATLVSDTEIFKGLYPEVPQSKKHIIRFDTEQSKFDAYRVSKRIKKMSKTSGNNFTSFGLRGLGCEKIIELIDYVVSEVHKNTLIIFIDQVADLVNSLNNEEEAVSIVRFLEKLSNEHMIHINCIVHQNKHDGYSQGWLGTQLMKKSETIIDVAKDYKFPSISHVTPNMTRGEDFEGFLFRINDNGYPELVSDEEKEAYIDNDI